MAIQVYDLVKDTTTTTGTGTVTLANSAPTGYRTFGAAAGGDADVFYKINNTPLTEWEVGIGTYTHSGATLSRTTIIASSNSGSAVSFSAGTKDVICVAPSYIFEHIDVKKSFYLSGELTPSQITADENDYNPTGLSTASVLRLDVDADRSITGLSGGADCRVITVLNISTFIITLSKEDTNSNAANRFDFDANIVLLPKRAATLWYDSTASRWKFMNSAITGTTIIPGNTTDKTIPQNATTYFGLAGNRAGTAGTGDTTDPSGTAADYERAFVVPKSGVIRCFYIQLDGSPGSGNQIAFTIMKNGVATAVTCTVSGTSAAGNDQVNYFSVAAGDLLALKCVASTTLTASRSATWSCEYVTDTGAVSDPAVLYLVKSADETVTSSATIQDDNHLNFAVAANRTYELSGAITADNTTNSIDIKVAFQLPTGGSINVYVLGVQDAGGLAIQGSARLTVSNTPKTITISGAVSTLIQFRGIVVIGNNSGNVKFRWAQGTSNATGTIVRANSYMVLRRVA
jgi:hypothetical protein